MADRSMGLNAWTREFLNRKPVLLYTEEIKRIYPDGRQESLDPHSVYQSVVIETENVERWDFEDDDETYATFIQPLQKYTFSSGLVYREKVQHVHKKKIGWLSSEETYFLALKDEGTGKIIKESLWTEEEIKSVCQ